MMNSFVGGPISAQARFVRFAGNWLAASCIMLLSMVFAPMALADLCDGAIAKATVEVKTKTGALSYDARTGLKELTKKARADKALPATASTYSMGLTAANWHSDARFRLTGRPVQGDTFCWSVSSLEVTITLDATIYIAKEILRDSCAWKQVNEHEQKHVKLDKKLLAGLPAIIEPKIRAARWQTVQSKDGKDALAIIDQVARKTISDAMDAFVEYRNKLQLAQIDTAAEYQRVDDACSDAEWGTIFKRAGLT
jgi:hypothetical protein